MEINIKAISNSELADQLEKLVHSERKITHLILNHILEFEDRKLYADLGFDSMFSYLTKQLGYCDSGAYRRLQSARLLRTVPELGAKLESGAFNLSQATQLQKCLREEAKASKKAFLENQTGDGINSSEANEFIIQSTEDLKTKATDLIKKLENLNGFETKKVLAVEFDQPLKDQEKAIPQKDESVRLEITLSKEQYEELEKAKNLLSHVVPDSSWADVISVLAFKFNKTKLGKSAQEKPTPNKNQIKAGPELTQSFCSEVVSRKHIAIKIRRQLLQKANSCCEYQLTTGEICGSKYQLQIDHLRPLALGGNNDPENLRVLCRTHNLLAARDFGLC